MVTTFGAVARAAGDLGKARVLAVLMLPMLGAIVLWSVLAFFFWDAWTGAFTAFLQDSAFGRWLASYGMRWTLETLSFIVVAALAIAGILVTAVAVTELVAMPVVVSVVERRYAGLEKRPGGSVAGSIVNATTGATVFVLLWIVTLPLWFTGIGAVIVPALNSAYLSQRLFRYDALSEHATREEYRALVARHRTRLLGLGLILAPLYYVPVVNLAAPVFTGLAFTHYCLGALAEMRKTA